MDITKTIVKRKRSKMETALLDIALHDDGNTSDDGWLEDSDDEWCVKRNNKESSDESNNSSDDLLSMEADKNLKHTQNAQDVVNNLACPKIVRVYSLSNTGTQEQRGRMGTDTDYAVSEDTGTRPSPHFSVQTTAKECRKSPDDKDVSHNKSKRIQLQPYQGILCGEITSPSQYSVDEYVSRVLQSMCSNHNEQMFLKGPASLMNQITSKINAECKHMGVFARPMRQTTETACVQEKTEIMKMKVNEGARECTNRRLAQVQKDRSPHRSRAHHGRTNDNDAANCSNTCENTESRKTLRQYHSRVDNTSNSPDEKMSLGKVCPDVSERGLHRHSTERCMSRNADSQKSLRQTDNSRRKDASNSPAEPVPSEEASVGTSKRVHQRDSKGRFIGHQDDAVHHRWYIQYPKLGDSNTFHVCVNTANSRDGNTPAVGRPKKKICRNKLGQFVRCRKAKQGAVISELKPCIHSHPQRETHKQDNEARLQSCHNDICGSPSQGKVEDISRIETTEKVQELPKDVKTDVFAVAKEDMCGKSQSEQTPFSASLSDRAARHLTEKIVLKQEYPDHELDTHKEDSALLFKSPHSGICDVPLQSTVDSILRSESTAKIEELRQVIKVENCELKMEQDLCEKSQSEQNVSSTLLSSSLNPCHLTGMAGLKQEHH